MHAFTGDHNRYLVTIQQDGVAVDVSSATSIKAALTSKDAIIVGPSTCTDDGNASWATGVIEVLLYDSSGAIEDERYYLEIQVTMDGEITTYKTRRQVEGRLALIT